MYRNIALLAETNATPDWVLLYNSVFMQCTIKDLCYFSVFLNKAIRLFIDYAEPRSVASIYSYMFGVCIQCAA